MSLLSAMQRMGVRELNQYFLVWRSMGNLIKGS